MEQKKADEWYKTEIADLKELDPPQKKLLKMLRK